MPETYIEHAVIVAFEAALAAGREILDVAAGLIRVDHKEDSSPLTEADRRAHHVIVQSLGAATPATPLLSEESLNLTPQERAPWTEYWLVDPLDGTKEFIQRRNEYTVNIALIRHGAPVAGVVYAPALDRAWFGGEGIGAHCIDGMRSAGDYRTLAGQATPLPRVVDRKSTTRPMTVVASRSHLNAPTQEFITVLQSTHPDLQFVSAGSSLKFCLVAEGAADIYPRFAPTMEWDTAAGHAVCTACGIPVTRQPDGMPLRYNKADLLNPWFIVDARI